jgi:hypothetical protein
MNECKPELQLITLADPQQRQDSVLLHSYNHLTSSTALELHRHINLTQPSLLMPSPST